MIIMYTKQKRLSNVANYSIYISKIFKFMKGNDIYDT